MEPIEHEFAEKGVLRGGILMLCPSVALVMVRKCREQGIAILGVDGFCLTPTTTQPVMEQSIDVSSLAESDAWSKAESFLVERLDSTLFFEVVVGT